MKTLAILVLVLLLFSLLACLTANTGAQLQAERALAATAQAYGHENDCDAVLYEDGEWICIK
jgi:hypothetical protein